jgi:hypothetical protein
MQKDAIAREKIKALDGKLDERDRRYNERFTAQEGANHLALEAAEKAVLKAETAAERRFEGVNEFRQTLSDQARDFITRKEVEALLLGVNATLSRLDTANTANTGRGVGMGQLWGWVVAAAGLALAAAAFLK